MDHSIHLVDEKTPGEIRGFNLIIFLNRRKFIDWMIPFSTYFNYPNSQTSNQSLRQTQAA